MSDDIFPEMPEKKHIDGKNLRLEQQLAAAQEQIKELRREKGDLQRLCERAALTLDKHWDELTDDEGYGYANLEQDLKKAAAGKEYKELRKLADMVIKFNKEKDEIIKELSEALLEAADDISAEYGYQHADKYRDLVEKAK